MSPILDSHGKVVRPNIKKIVQPSHRDRWSSHPAEGLTPTRLSSILKMAEAGSLTSQAELFEQIEEKDSQVFSCIQTRKLSVVNKEWEIIPASNEAIDENIADKVRENFENLEDFEDDMLDLLDAIGKGYSICEINWLPLGKDTWLNGLDWVHPKRFVLDDQNKFRLLNENYSFKGLELEPNKFIIHQYRGRSGLSVRAGIYRTICWMYLFKNYDIKDWVAFTELYGIPLRLGKYSPGTSEPDIAVLEDAVKNLGSDGAAVIPDSTMIEFKEAVKTSSLNVFKDLAAFCDAQITKAILGQTGTTEDTPGKLGNQKEKGDVRQDLIESDAKSLQQAIRWQLIKPLVDFNFGIQKKYPTFKIKYEPAEDLLNLARRDSILIKTGVAFPQSYFNNVYAIPEVQEDVTMREVME